jgi:hypothetical protein
MVKEKQTYSYPFIEFRFLSANGRTEVWEAWSKAGVPLGTIKWYAPWRRYAFTPTGQTVFDVDCLDYIRHFLIKLMVEWKVGKER